LKNVGKQTMVFWGGECADEKSMGPINCLVFHIQNILFCVQN